MKRRKISILTLISSLLLLSSCSSASAQEIVSNVVTEIPSSVVSEKSITSESPETSILQSTLSETNAGTKETISTVTTIEYITTTSAETAAYIPETLDGQLTVHFIDVGQGDSTFIELPNSETMLIDAGDLEYGDKVVTYIFSQGYDTVDYVVATHPHSDHIGGMAAVLDNFNVGGFYSTAEVSATFTYEHMLSALEQNGAAVHDVMAGTVILNNGNLLIEVVAPKVINSEEMNNNSVVIKLTYGDTRFLFAGDAEKSEEDGIWTNIKCDVLKIGHHGSSGSTSDNFLKKVNPTYAVISAGLGNSYGHPTDKVLKRLDSSNIQTFRTDTQGTIVFTSNGTDISVDKSPSVYEPNTVTTTTSAITTEPVQIGGSTTYILNTNTKKFHYPYCSSVSDMAEKNKREYEGTRDEVIGMGYVPCKRCCP